MKVAVALCGACGASPLDGLARLTEAENSVELWWAADFCGDPASLRQLCESGVESLIVLGASEPNEREAVRAAAESGGIHPLNLDFVDVPLDRSAAASEAVLRGAIAATRDFRSADERHVKRTARVRGVVTRRAFLQGMRPSAVIAIPRILEDRCRSSSGCDLCVAACPVDALEIRGGVARFHAADCTGCDCCVAACPTGALINPVSEYARLRDRVEGWVAATPARPRRLVLACAPSVMSVHHGLAGARAPFPLFLEVPCLGALRAAEYVDLLAAGIDQVICTRDPPACEEAQGCRDPMPRALRVLSDRTEFRDRVVTATPEMLPQALREPLPSLGRERPASPFESLHEAIAWVDEGKETTVRVDGRGAGFVEIRGDQCTGCLVCRDCCPTGALTAPAEPESLRIEFVHGRCDGCGLCEAVCPERALTVHREVRTGLGEVRVTLFSDDWVHCRRCGARVAPRKMIVELSGKTGQSVESLETCPDCRLWTPSAAWTHRLEP